MDARDELLRSMRDYAARSAGAVDEAMLAQWDSWLQEFWAHSQEQSGDQSFRADDAALERTRLSHKYLAGDGIEIGALYNPLPVPEGARVRYVDKARGEALRLLYFEVSQYTLVEPDFLEDGRTLPSFADGSLDFVISSHFLEHCDDPIGALSRHVGVLRPGGVLYLAVPDCRKTFDAPRAVTTLEHLWRDYEEGPQSSREEHYRDWALHVNGRTGADLESWWRLLDAVDYSIHFHVWRPMDVLELLLDVGRRLGLAIDVREFVQHAEECVAIVERTG